MRRLGVVGDGDPQDPVVEAQDEAGSVLEVPVLRSAGLPDIPGDRKHCQVVLFIGVQVFVCLCKGKHQR